MRTYLTVLIVGAMLASLAFPAAAEVRHGDFWIELNPDNSFKDGGGSGYDGGQWYEYDNNTPSWWNQWYYNDPPDPDRWKEITYNILIDFPTDPPGGGGETLVQDEYYVEIALNWSTLAFPESGPLGPPPIPPLTPAEEALYLDRFVIFANWVMAPTPVIGNYEIPDFNPEWVSIDVRVDPVLWTNPDYVIVSGDIWHECVPEPATIGLLGAGVLALLRRRKRS